MKCKVCGIDLAETVDCPACGTRNPNVTVRPFELLLEESLLLAVNRWTNELGETVQNFVAIAIEDRIKHLWAARLAEKK